MSATETVEHAERAFEPPRGGAGHGRVKPTSATSGGGHEAATRARASRTHAREWLSFRLGAEEYGVDILRVQEIRGYEQPTRIAGAPDCILGVLNLRGVIVPIVDLRSRLRLEPRFDNLTVTVVLHVGGRVVGAVVDSVSDVVELDSAQIEPAPQIGRAVDAGFIDGIGCLKQGDRQRMLILLDIQALVGSAIDHPFDAALT